jgi:hypothetical protein
MMGRSTDREWINQNLLFSLPMKEGTGSSTVLDIAKPHHPVTQVHAPVWTQLASGLWVMDFTAAHPDFLECLGASSTDLNFTTGDFSACMWINLEVGPTNATFQPFLQRGAWGTNGWCWEMKDIGGAGGQVMVGWDDKYCYATLGVGSGGSIGTWQLIGFSRTGTTVSIFRNAVSLTVTTHTLAGNPTTTASDLHAFIQTDEATGAIDGKMWNPRIWGRALTAAEHKQLFDQERSLFGV